MFILIGEQKRDFSAIYHVQAQAKQMHVVHICMKSANKHFFCDFIFGNECSFSDDLKCQLYWIQMQVSYLPSKSYKIVLNNRDINEQNIKFIIFPFDLIQNS